MEIAEMMVVRQQSAFDEASRRAFREYLAVRVAQPLIASVRSVRHALDRAKRRQSDRGVRAGGYAPRSELRRIDEVDIKRSRVFRLVSRQARTATTAEE